MAKASTPGRLTCAKAMRGPNGRFVSVVEQLASDVGAAEMLAAEVRAAADVVAGHDKPDASNDESNAHGGPRPSEKAGASKPANAGRSSKPTKTGDASTTITAVKKAAANPRSLVQKIYDVIDRELAKLEEQEGPTSQDRERASRALSQMVGSLEKAVDMQRDMTKPSSKGAKKQDAEALRHAEDLRREIAQRLERLGRERRDVKRPG